VIDGAYKNHCHCLQRELTYITSIRKLAVLKAEVNNLTFQSQSMNWHEGNNAISVTSPVVDK